eukprot:scaffold32157_cov31-Tisochrysis_lutea.AAC.2
MTSVVGMPSLPYSCRTNAMKSLDVSSSRSSEYATRPEASACALHECMLRICVRSAWRLTARSPTSTGTVRKKSTADMRDLPSPCASELLGK